MKSPPWDLRLVTVRSAASAAGSTVDSASGGDAAGEQEHLGSVNVARGVALPLSPLALPALRAAFAQAVCERTPGGDVRTMATTRKQEK